MKAYYLLFVINLLIGEVLFTDITSDAGISFSGMSEGVCVFDYNNDGFGDDINLDRLSTRLKGSPIVIISISFPFMPIIKSRTKPPTK